VKARLLGSLLLGAIAAAIVVVYDDTANHAALVRAAAQPQPHGGHQSVTSILAAGFVSVTLFVALVVFVAGTVLAGRRKARAAAASRAWQGTPQPRRRGRAGAGQ
jgi:hypothetical protein